MKEGQVDKRNKVLVIGLDGGTYTVLRPLIEDGKLPTLAAMMNQGSWGELASTIPPHTAPAWASFATGKNPGKHGVFQFGPVDRSLYEGQITRIVNSKMLSGQALWTILGNGGKKVGVINVPLTYPPYPVNGFMVTGMLTPRETDHFTYPLQLAETIGDYTIDLAVGEGQYGILGDLNTENPEVLAELIEQLNVLAERRSDLAVRLMKAYSPDFFMILFTETDRLQHILWPYLKPDQGQFETTSRKLRGAVEDFYRRLDAHLTRLVEMAGENAIKILMSDHGFGPATKKNVNFNVWLRDRGLLKLRDSPQRTLKPRWLLRRMGLSKEMLYALLSSLLPGKAIRRMGKVWGKVASSPIDWNRTQAVFIPLFEFVGGIEIIQGDHEPTGHYEDFRNSLIQRLLELRDPQTNEPIVLEAFKREEIYRGAHTCEAPDIVFVMGTDYRGDKGLLSKSLVTQKPKHMSLWTGTHRMEGLVILNGPSISPGRICSAPQIQDLTSTILYLLGVAIPEDMDGRVIEEAIEPHYIARHKIEYTEPTSRLKEDPLKEAVAFSKEDMEKVRKQLEGLGYLS